MKTRACERCKALFTYTRPRRFCDRQCAISVSLSSRKIASWSEEEKHYLRLLAGTLPLPDLVKKFQAKARREGWPPRTTNAVEIKLGRLGESQKCTLDNFTIWGLARALGVGFDRVELWTQRGLQYRKVARNQGAIAIKDFIRFCKEQPERVAGVDPELLEWVTGDAELAEAIAKLPPPRIGYAQPVQRLDTGEVFPSIRSAAKASFIHKRSIAQAIARDGTSAGTKWRYVNKQA